MVLALNNTRIALQLSSRAGDVAGTEGHNGSESMEHPTLKSNKQPSLVTGCTMKQYQIQGLDWLIGLYENGLNGILADEMGLGKLTELGVTGPFLIVAPVATLDNWINEIKRFAPSINCLLYYGTAAERKQLRSRDMALVDASFPWIVTSYSIVMNDRKYLQKYLWKYIVIDEGHRIKNLDCKLLKQLKQIESANRLLLTGTPLQNNLTELWSLLNFLMPEIFSELGDFLEWFDFQEELQGEEQVDAEELSAIVRNLHNILKPFMLRRTKAEVEKELPVKREYLVYCPLTEKQMEFYQAALKGSQGLRAALSQRPAKKKRRLADENTDPSTNESSPSSESTSHKHLNGLKLQNMVMQLRKVCNHPSLFDVTVEEEEDEVSEEIDQEYQVLGLKESSPSKKSKVNYKHKNGNTKIDSLHDTIKASGKMLMLERILPSLLSKGHKVLIFSQMTRMLDILAEYIAKHGWSFCRIDGATDFETRKEEISRFYQDLECKIFLLSTRSGGLGLNLANADTVILYDSDWNPQMDLQAQDRAHRIGQSRPVSVFRFLSAKSVEVTMHKKATTKRKLERLVMHKKQFKGHSKYYTSANRISAKELEDLLEDVEHVEVEASFDSSVSCLKDLLSDKELELLLDRKEAHTCGRVFQLVHSADTSLI